MAFRALVFVSLVAMFATGRTWPADAVPNGQLPDEVLPERYRLQLDLDPRRPEFYGVTEIDVVVLRPLRRIWLHGLGLKVRSITVESGSTRLTGTYEEVEPINGVARVVLPSELPANKATLRFEYSASFEESAQGLYRVQVGKQWYAFSQFEAIDARRVFPGFDEPRFKTSFEVSVLAHSGDRAISNAPLGKTTPASSDAVLHAFEPTLPLPTYLVAFAVGPLDVIDATMPASAVRSRPLPLRGVATQGKGPELAYALEHTPAIVEQLEAYFGMPFPYPKLDVIASPEMPGAMENAGAIIFNDTLLLLDKSPPPAQQRGFYHVMAHEVAHHWFGDLVTPGWWEDIWLNESFAQWMGVKVANELRPDLGSRANMVYAATSAMDVDAKLAGRPMRQPVTDNSQIIGTFDAITYQKGAQVLSMVESFLGEETFRQGVRRHLRSHMNGVATSDEFFASLSEAAQRPPVMAALRSFVEQPGVPLVSFERDGADATELRATQDRYLPLGTALTGGQLWKLPLCVHAYAAAPAPIKSCSLLTERTGSVVVSAGAIVMPNADGAGYYRFALSADALQRLVALSAKLSEPEAIMLADSLGAVFRAGKLPFDELLAASRQLATHPSRLASISLGWQLVDIKDRWADAVTRAALAAHIRSLYAPRLEQLGLDVRRGAYENEPADQRQLRRSFASLIVQHGRDAALRAKLADAARRSLTEPAVLDPEFRSLTWSVGVQELGDPFAVSLESAMLASQDSQLREDAAAGIGAAEDDKSSARALALSQNDAVRTVERFWLLSGQFSSPATRDRAWDWLVTNYDHLLKRLPSIAKDASFGLAESFCDAKRRPEIDRTLMTKSKAIGSGELEVRRTIEGIDLCVAQRAALEPSVAAAMGTR
jgi:aminopeptidase N